MIDLSIVANYILLILIVLTAYFTISSTNIIESIILLSLFSFLMTLLYIFLDAPDVAITECAIGACITTVILLSVHKKIKENKITIQNNYGKLVLFILLSAQIILYSFDLPIFAEYHTKANTHLASYFIENSATYIGIKSIVASILASYRGYDTLGETFVIFTGTVCVFAILKGNKKFV